MDTKKPYTFGITLRQRMMTDFFYFWVNYSFLNNWKHVNISKTPRVLSHPVGWSSHQWGVSWGQQSETPHLSSHNRPLHLLLFFSSSFSFSKWVDECTSYVCSWQSVCNLGAECFFRVSNWLHMEKQGETLQRFVSSHQTDFHAKTAIICSTLDQAAA